MHDKHINEKFLDWNKQLERREKKRKTELQNKKKQQIQKELKMKFIYIFCLSVRSVYDIPRTQNLPF